MRQCPQCYHVGLYATFANGLTEVGYCQNCGYESKTTTTKKDYVPKIVVERPQKKEKHQSFKRNK